MREKKTVRFHARKLHSSFTAPQMINHIVLWILLIMLLYPFGLLLWSSLKGSIQFEYSPWFPTLPLWFQNYEAAFPLVWRYIYNTVLVGVVGTAGSVLEASIGAFVFARMQFYGKEFLYYLIIALMMVPGILSLVPGYILYKNFGMLNSYWVLIVPMWTIGPVFGIFLLRQFFAGIPEEIFEAARIDGANTVVLFYRICIPLSLPIIITLAVMSILGTWNDLLWPMVTISSNHLLTISAGLVTQFATMYATNYPLEFAGYTLAAIPLVILFFFTSKYYVEGLTSSAIKL